MSTTDMGEAIPIEPSGPVLGPDQARAPDVPWLSPPIAWYAVCMVALVTLVGQLDYGIMALLVQPIKHDTGMSDVQISLLLGAAYSGVYLCCGIPLARLSDRSRRTWVLAGGMTVWSIGTLLCGFAQGFWPFAAFRGITGGAISVKGPTTMSIIPDLVPREKLARAFGIYNVALIAGQSLSLIIGGLLLGALLKHPPIHLPGFEIRHAWQMVFILMGLPGLGLAVIVLLTVPEPLRHGAKRQGSVPIGELVHFLFRGPASKVFIPIIVGTALAGLLLAGTGAWRAAFYARTYHIPAHVYGPLSGLISLVTAPIGVIIGSWVVERMQGRWNDALLRIAVYGNLIALPISILSPLMPTFQLALACQFVYGVVLLASAPSQLAAMQIITPNEMRAQVNAVYMVTISVIGQGLGPTVVAMMTQYLFRAEADLRYALVTAAAISTPITLGCLILALKPFGRLYRQAAEAEADAAA